MNRKAVFWTVFMIGLLLGGTAFYLTPRLAPATPLSNSSGEPRSLSDLVNFTKISSLKESTLTPLSTDWESALATIQQYQGTAPIYNEACSKYSCPGGAPIALSRVPQTFFPQKPAPAAFDHFGFAIASIGSDILIGTPNVPSNGNAGAAWLFDGNGNLLTTFREPSPANGNWFGYSVAGVGGNVLIGASSTTVGNVASAGSAYLFRTNGTLITTYHEPTPGSNDQFGLKVAGFGNDVLVGSPQTTVAGLANAGAAYLFDGAGNLLVTFREPTPAANDNFGYSPTVLGDDILITAPRTLVNGFASAGAAYLFDSSGDLLSTYHEPSPSVNAEFGVSSTNVAGNVLVGTFWANQTGAAYLFNTEGQLLTTYHDPTPASGHYFGYDLASVGNNTLVGSIGTTVGGSTVAGAAYLFNSNGNLLTTYHEPTPGGSDEFGLGLSSLNGNAVIGAANTGVGGNSDAGAAYVFDTSGNLLSSLQETTRPTGDQFGGEVSTLAFVGSDLVVGAAHDNSNAGIAYVFDNTGRILITLQDPVPVANDYFGLSVIGFGGNILVGADGNNGNAGAAFLFDNNGNLLTTFRKSGATTLGYAMTVVGANVLISAANNQTAGLSQSGAAYLFDPNGNVLSSYREPTPVANDQFGFSVATVGSNILIGAPARAIGPGAAYLFNGNGALLTTFHDPLGMLGDDFGFSVSSLGNDIIIGAPAQGFARGGAAYLFDTSGNLLKTFNDPSGPGNVQFAWSVAGVGGDILVGTPIETVGGVASAGAAYLFDTNGNLLRSFSEPKPVYNDQFGYTVGAGNTVVIGSPLSGLSGAAYVYRQFGLRDSCAAAIGPGCLVVTETGSFQAGTNSVSMNVVAVTLRSAINATLGTQMALTIMCNKAVADAGLQCSALYIDGNSWGPSRDALKGSFLIVNAEPYFYLQWHWWDPTNQRIVAWSYWWYGNNPNRNWYWTVYLYWRTYTANNLGVWTPWWWWWWHWTYYLYWNYRSAGVSFSGS